jgi:membrane protease YdiL (CAAX protease family)
VFPFAPYISFPGWYHLIAFGVFIPLMAIRSWWKLRDKKRPLPNRLIQLKATAVTLVVFTVASLTVAALQDIDLFPLSRPPLAAVGAGIAMYAMAVTLMRPRWRRAVERRARVVYLFMPENTTERVWWIAVSILAGLGEEITWRGAQTALLAAVTGSYVVAVALSALSFAIAHFVQGWRSSLVIVGFALGFHGLVWLSGSLYVAMAVHIAYDITAGLTYGKLGRELGYTVEQTADQALGTGH